MNRDEIIAANPIADFVRSRGHELKRAGENFETSGCPVTQHKRGHRPVMIYPKTQSWNCHDCEVGGTVIDWLANEKGISGADALRDLADGNDGARPAAKIVKTYDYTDESGNLLYQTCRYQPKDFRQRRPDGKGGWIWNLDGIGRVLYRLPEVLKAQTVCVAEGEKDCDSLAKLGFVATTNPLGAGKWRDEYSETLRGKTMLIFGDVGDSDQKGERHTEQVIQSLSGKAKLLTHVRLPDGFHDVSDFIASLPRNTAAQAIAKLIDEAPAAVEVPKPPSLGTLLDEICAFVRQYISFTSEAQPSVIALWIVHTWFIDCFEFTPYLHIFSPTRSCGKSHLLDCIAKLVRNVLSTVSLTVAALFRTIEQDQPTLLIDEVDNIFSKGNENEELRAILNAGFERGSTVRRCVGPNFDLKDFAVFCPKALAGIGQLPDTVSDRCIPIHLIAKKKSDKVQRFRKREVNVKGLAAALEGYSQKPEIVEALRNGRAEVPEISDRQNDIAEGLIVIADLAGGDWPSKVRRSLIELFSAKEEGNIGVELLASCRVAFGDQDRIATKDLLEKLIEEETGTPWAHWWENDLNKAPPNIRGPAANIARLLKPFGIKARVIKMPDDSTSRGYLREDFEDSWNRYCPYPQKKT
jgi:hypothetical protein